MNKTKIEWVKNPDGTQGYTWNPITGCLNHVSGMCKGGNFPCYAYRLANTRLKERYLANDIIGETDPRTSRLRESFANPFFPRFWPERLYDLRGEGGYDNAYPARNAYHASREKVKGIFVCDMSDLFGIGVPEEWTRRVLEVMRLDVELNGDDLHRFYLLTKQPQNLAKFSPFPDNCWVGVTVCNDGMMTLALTNLASVEAKVRYLSIEPCLGFISMKSHPIKGIVDQIIIGAQTKPYKPPEISWVQEIVEAADKAGIPVFLKENIIPALHGLEPFYKPLSLSGEGSWKLRQEMPK